MIVRTELDKLPASLRAELSASGIDVGELYDAIETALDEDLPEPRPGEMPAEDVTSVATIPIDARARGDFAVREAGVVSGLGVAALVFHYVLGEDVEITDRAPDGTRVQPGDVVMRVAGPTRGLLTAERTALNYATHLSGVATATAAWVEAVAGTRAQILDTRKTLPTYRNLQKYAVRCGGGVNHRSTLAEMALVKDNHVVAAGGVVPAFRAVRTAFPAIPVEVEVTSLDELRELLAEGCDRILLDNMSADQMREAVSITGGRATLEASGGLTVERAREVAETGVDFISIGALTHSLRVFDIGFDLESAQGV
jgi:nicotinate-nucleotide pyrophosphorylase (carboxylating)